MVYKASSRKLCLKPKPREKKRENLKNGVSREIRDKKDGSVQTAGAEVNNVE